MRAALVLAGAAVAFVSACGETPTEPPDTPALVFTTTALADAQLRMPYMQALAASGGKQPYTFSVKEGVLPEGITLTNATLGGTPTAPGRVSLTLEVKDSAGAAVSKALTLYVVPDALMVTTASISGATELQAYSFTLLGAGGVEPYRWTVSTGALPAGLSLSADGDITGTASVAGSSMFTVQVADAEMKTASKELSMTVRPLLPMIITSTLPRALVRTPYDARIEVGSGHAPYTFAVAMGMLPRGITLDATGRLSGQPTVSGVYRFTVRVTDARQRTDEVDLGLVVLAPLAITTRTLPDVTLARPYMAQFEASGGVRPYIWQITGTLPVGLTADDQGLISGQTSQAGDYPLTVRVADDAGGVRTAMYTLHVIDVLTVTVTPMAAFPPTCSVPGNPTRCVPWTQSGNMTVCTSTQVSYQTVQIPVMDSFAIESMTVAVDVDYADAGLSYNSGNAAQNRNTRLRLLLTAPDGRLATLCGNDNGHRQMTGCYAGQNDPNSTGGVHTTYPDNTAATGTPLTVFNGMNARGVWRFQTSVAWPTTDQNGNCHQAGTINSVTLNFRVDRSVDPYVTLSGFTYNNLIREPWVRVSGGNQVANNNSIQLVATLWEVGPNGHREGGQGDDVPSMVPFAFTGVGLPNGTVVTPTGFVTGGPDTGTAQVRGDDGAGHTFTRRLLIVPPDWNRKVRDF